MSAPAAAVAAPRTNSSRPAARAAADDLVQAVLDDRDLTPVEQVDLVGVDVGAGHLVTELREAGAGRETDVAGPHDRD